MTQINYDPGSFKDPDAGVLYYQDRVYRAFTDSGAKNFKSLAESRFLERLISQSDVIASTPVSPDVAKELREAVPEAAMFVEHPRIPFVSYCYEWPFEMLQAAALLHLRILRVSLESGFTLKDATPYNVQFIGPKPQLIDIASFEPYVPGEPWSAYNEFCRLFLNPILFQAVTGIGFQQWLRGSLQGIEPAHLSRLLPLRHKLRPRVFINVVLQSWLQRKFGATDSVDRAIKRPQIGLNQLLNIIGGLEKTISRSKLTGNRSQWQGYDDDNSYSAETREAKENFVERVLSSSRPKVLWDLGSNTGRYSLIAAKHAEHVIAIDQDANTVGALYRKSQTRQANVLPLVVDILDPSPGRGWAQEERAGLLQRGPADMVLALALVHHLAISGNIPLSKIAFWLSRIARTAIIEFVPKDDPALRRLLRWRQDIYTNYSQPSFESALREHFQIIEQRLLPGSGRILYSIARKEV